MFTYDYMFSGATEDQLRRRGLICAKCDGAKHEGTCDPDFLPLDEEDTDNDPF